MKFISPRHARAGCNLHPTDPPTSTHYFRFQPTFESRNEHIRCLWTNAFAHKAEDTVIDAAVRRGAAAVSANSSAAGCPNAHCCCQGKRRRSRQEGARSPSDGWTLSMPPSSGPCNYILILKGSPQQYSQLICLIIYYWGSYV